MAFADLLEAADRAAFDHLGGSAVTYTAGDGSGAATVDGIFDAAYVLVDVGQAGVSSSTPAVFLRLADLTSDPSVDSAFRIAVGGVTYKERETKPDGLGGVLILLHEA